jgi:hypothetical protein
MRIDGRKLILLLALAGFAGVLIVLAKSFMAISVPYSFTQFWTSNGTIGDWLWTAKWWFLFGTVSTAVMAYVNLRLRQRAREQMRNVAGGLGGFFSGVMDTVAGASYKIELAKLLLSPVRGFLGEVGARWIGFFVVIILVQFFNALLFNAWLGFGVFHILQVYLLGPVTNFATLHIMPEYVNNPAIWAVGFAVFACSIRTNKDNHSYEGLSPILAWFFNLFLFYLMFTFGIWASIVVHFVWDVLLGGITFGFAAYEMNGD